MTVGNALGRQSWEGTVSADKVSLGFRKGSFGFFSGFGVGFMRVC
jgi:hypothetical protein